jgi:TetR/AcrR family transcriptional regulator, repressor for uid operon
VRKVDPVKHAEKRQKILDAAERCFVRDGFRGASISEICAEAGISPGHLYHYFPSKEAILEAITESGLVFVASRVDHMMQSSNVLEALLAAMERPKPRRERNPHALLLEMVAEGGRNPAIGEILHKHSRALQATLCKFLREGQARGQIDPTLDADVAAAILIGVIDGAKLMSIRNPAIDATKSADLLKVLMARFLSPAAKKARATKAGQG